ncbi:MAG: hypothetical protein RLZ10_262 [Bacteroidota bacterium]|jgi:hypothetical protein
MKKTLIFGFSLLFIMIASFVSMATLGLDVKEAVGLSVGVEAVMLFASYKMNRNLSFIACGGIIADLIADCDTPVQSGTQDKIWIWNFADVEGLTTEELNLMVVTAITMKATKTGFSLTGFNNSNMPNYAMFPTTFVNKWDHTVPCKVFNIDPATKLNLESMKEGLFMVATENVNKGVDGNSAFELYGADAGLKLTSITRDPNSADTQGAFDLIFSSPKNKQNYMPRTIFDTDYATSLAIIEDTLA